MRVSNCLLSLTLATAIAFSVPVFAVGSHEAAPRVNRNSSREGGIDHARAARYFAEAKQAAEDDGGNLWGISLAGPMMFFDSDTGEIVANQADAQGKLTAQDGIFVGKAASDFVGANTSLEWSGVNWTVVMWPLPKSNVDRLRLMMHECFHRIQSQVGLPPAGPKNEQLNTKDGRIWLLLEYRALQKALPSWGKERHAALEDALAFRAYRQSLFPGSKKEEDRMEMHEGMAEYTGFACSGLSNNEARYYMSGRVKLAALKPSLSYAFAYETGPIYGLLLDMQSKTWRKDATPNSSLADMLANLAKVDVGTPSQKDVVHRAKAYDGDALIAAENDRENKRLAQEKVFLKNYVEGPVLILPMGNFSFDPNTVSPFTGHGTMYGSCKVTGPWGSLEVTGYAMFAKDFSTATVPAPKEPSTRKGDGWTLTLNPGWKLIPGKRPGDLVPSQGEG